MKRAESAQEFFASRAIVEQEKPLADNDPHIRIAGHRDAARDTDRIIAAILRHVDVGPFGEGGAIADIAEAPDSAAVTQFELGAARHRLAVGEEGDRIVAADREPGVPIDHDPLRQTGERAPGTRADRAAAMQAIVAKRARYRFRFRRAAVIVLTKAGE